MYSTKCVNLSEGYCTKETKNAIASIPITTYIGLEIPSGDRQEKLLWHVDI